MLVFIRMDKDVSLSAAVGTAKIPPAQWYEERASRWAASPTPTACERRTLSGEETKLHIPPSAGREGKTEGFTPGTPADTQTDTISKTVL